MEPDFSKSRWEQFVESQVAKYKENTNGLVWNDEPQKEVTFHTRYDIKLNPNANALACMSTTKA